MTMYAIRFGVLMTTPSCARIPDSLQPDQRKAPTDISPLPDYRQASDEELLAVARVSDERAFAELSRRYAMLIHNTVSKIVRHREDAEDVVQDTLFKA